MNFFFKNLDAQQVVSKITDALGGRELGNILTIDLDQSKLNITISKLGTSTLSFEQKSEKDGVRFSLSQENIAFTHRIFKDQVVDKIKKLITNLGGEIA